MLETCVIGFSTGAVAASAKVGAFALAARLRRRTPETPIAPAYGLDAGRAGLPASPRTNVARARTVGE